MSEANLFSEGDPELLEQAGQLLSEAKQAHDHMDTLLQEENSRQAREISSSSTPLPSVQDLVEQDKLCQYTRWLMTLHHLKETCLELLEAGRILPELRTAFVNLRTLHVSLDGPSRCRHLSLYAGGTLTGLYKIVADRLVQGLERELEHLNFPACILAEDQCVSLSGGGPETLNKFRSHFTFLSSLIPLLEGEGSSLSITPVRPHTILFHPLRKRFQYHFCGTKKTNNLVRPEWYLQQVRQAPQTVSLRPHFTTLNHPLYRF